MAETIQKGRGRPKKTFAETTGQQLEQASQEGGGALEKLFAQIPLSGDDLLADLLDTTSDRTVEQPKPAPIEVMQVTPEPPLPEEIVGGEEVQGVNAQMLEKINQGIQKGMSFEDADAQVRVQQPVRNDIQGPGSDSPYVQPERIAEHREPLSEMDTQMNRIAADELVAWYDVLQSVASVWMYERVSSPKQAADVVTKLTDKVATGKAQAGEIAMFKEAQQLLVDYTGRKTKFAETVAMSDSLKIRTAKLLDRILEAKNIRIPPEVLLGFLLLTPLIVNGGRILLEKFGFEGGDQLVKRFTNFVESQEAEFNG
jgi:hypothetical protein